MLAASLIFIALVLVVSKTGGPPQIHIDNQSGQTWSARLQQFAISYLPRSLQTLVIKAPCTQGLESVHLSGSHTAKELMTDPSGDGLDIPEALRNCQIYQWLQNGDFWDKDFVKDILPQIKLEFAPELQHLKAAKADKKGVGNGRRETFAMALFAGEDGTFTDADGTQQDMATSYYEIDRSLTSVRALLWLKNDQAETFNGELAQVEKEAVRNDPSTNGQPPWTWLRQQFMTPEANVFLREQAHVCYGLITSVIINDLGKDINIAAAYKQHTGQTLEAANHDAHLRACVDAGMVPSIDRLPQALKKSILLGIEVSAECNLGQTAQAENIPASLYALTRFRQDPVAWRLRFMEQVLDLAGAKGHVNNQCAVVFSPFVAAGNQLCHKVGEQVLQGVKPLVAYNAYLQSRYEDLVRNHGYNSTLMIENPSHRALMRIFCMAGCQSRSIAELLEDVLLRSDDTSAFRDELIAALNEDGLDRPAVQVTYLPALLDGVLKSEWDNPSQLQQGLAAALEYAHECLKVNESTREQWRQEGITAVERDIFEATQWVKLGCREQDKGKHRDGDEASDQPHETTCEFLANPRLLATYEVPSPMVINRAEVGDEHGVT